MSSLLGGGLLAMPHSLSARTSQPLVIAHTNDIHSRLDPFPQDGSALAGLGGVKARKQAIDKLRALHEDVLLLDCGDMFQGTPYFNFYKGEAEIKSMNYLGYNAGTLGNHDFDGGLDNLALQISAAQFPIINANYDFTNTVLENKIPPYIIKNIGSHKVGIIGIGIDLDGLVPKQLFGNISYSNPIEKMNYFTAHLKRKKKCDFVIVLSHLGYEYKNAKKISDQDLARESYDVDLILGGHTHTFLDEPKVLINMNKKNVFINQVGWGGVQLGVLKFDKFQEKNTEFGLKAHNGIFLKETSI